MMKEKNHGEKQQWEYGFTNMNPTNYDPYKELERKTFSEVILLTQSERNVNNNAILSL